MASVSLSRSHSTLESPSNCGSTVSCDRIVNGECVKNRLMCRFYLRGHCRDGDGCAFSHDTTVAITIPDHCCWYYLQSRCMYGDNCRFLHMDADTIIERYDSKGSEKPFSTLSSFSSTPMSCTSESRQWSEDSGYGEDRADLRTYAEAIGAVQLHDDTHDDTAPRMSVSEMAKLPLCPYAISSIDGVCPYPTGECGYVIHGDVCDLCGRTCVHPYNEQQQKEHRDECIKEHEKEMELSFAIQRSIDKACGICMDIIMEKEPVTERRFGILEKCIHIFCLSCIRKWRQTRQFDNRTIRACPECRVASDFVIPSKYWYDSKEDKEQLIVSYKRALSTKPCKYFKQGQGECPFAGACFYLHAYPDGRKADMAPPRPRRRQNQQGELETLRDMLLWNYLEVRDDRWLLTLDLEELIDVGLFSETDDDDDDESDVSDYDIA